MTESKHTPGPWKADGNGVITGGEHFCTSIATTPVVFWRDKSTYGHEIQEKHFEQYALEAEANARLIADAPDLLEENTRLRAEVERLKAEANDGQL